MSKITKIVIAICALIGTQSFAQTNTNNAESNYFAQGMFDISDDQVVLELQNTLRSNPAFIVVRLDVVSHRFFVLIEPTPSGYTEENVRSWFMEHGDKIDCIQIGVHGIDQVRQFPFQNCSN